MRFWAENENKIKRDRWLSQQAPASNSPSPIKPRRAGVVLAGKPRYSETMPIHFQFVLPLAREGQSHPDGCDDL